MIVGFRPSDDDECLACQLGVSHDHVWRREQYLDLQDPAKQEILERPGYFQVAGELPHQPGLY